MSVLEIITKPIQSKNQSTKVNDEVRTKQAARVFGLHASSVHRMHVIIATAAQAELPPHAHYRMYTDARQSFYEKLH